MNNLNDLIREAEDFDCIDAVDDVQISMAERKLGLVFAKDYADYLRTFGVATFCNRELTGICTSERLSVIATTERAREYYPEFPMDVYVIEELLIDHIIIVQNSNGSILSYGPDDSAKRVASSLQEFLFPETVI